MWFWQLWIQDTCCEASYLRGKIEWKMVILLEKKMTTMMWYSIYQELLSLSLWKCSGTFSFFYLLEEKCQKDCGRWVFYFCFVLKQIMVGSVVSLKSLSKLSVLTVWMGLLLVELQMPPMQYRKWRGLQQDGWRWGEQLNRWQVGK